MYFCGQLSINRICFRDRAVGSLPPVEMGSPAVAAPWQPLGAGAASPKAAQGWGPCTGPRGVAPLWQPWRERREVSVRVVAGGAGGDYRLVVLREKIVFTILVKDG